MQRLFFMFPTGWPGFGLVLLRLSVGLAFVVEVCDRGDELSGALWIVAVLISLALCAGCLTPIATVAALACHAIVWSTHGVVSAALATTVAFDACALALLGPGAYSIDAYRFGRRVMLLPPS